MMTRHPGFQSLSQGTSPTTTPVFCSGFQIELMPSDKIKRRTPMPYSVHYSLPSSCWIATIVRHPESSTSEQNKLRYSQFSFDSERQAQKFAKAYSPPKMDEPSERCYICAQHFTPKIRPFSCRNCGVCICEGCSARWGARMIPKTYVHSGYQPHTVRVCKSCDWLSNAFCMALLQGRYQDAVKIHETGNVNLRTCFADIKSESMFPVHCCTIGGNVELLKWLVETQQCPVSVKRSKEGKMLSVKTSSDRTLIDLAMTGRPKLDILMYLVHKGLSIQDCTDNNLTSRTLEALLKAGLVPNGPAACAMNKSLAIVDPSEGSNFTIENAVRFLWVQGLSDFSVNTTN